MIRNFQILGTLGVTSCAFLTGCLPSNTTSTSTAKTTATSSPAIPNGPRAVKIIFKQVTDGGSFATPASSGTTNAAGSGVQITQVFNADGTTLSTSPTATTWPQWLSSVELGVSGSSNSNAGNSDCARFASVTSGDSSAVCKFKYPAADTTNCGAPAGYYRVSDYDCNSYGTASARGIGTGIDTDGVYIRATFNRATTALGANENILAVLEYSASALNSAPSNPTTCFSGGSASVESCADQTWRIFTKHSVSEVLQPFLLLVPPAFASVNTTTGLGGSGISTKQFVIPLAGDPNLTILQITRTGSPLTSTTGTDFQNICAPNGLPANSAFCVGMVFYSLTLYRI